MSSFLSFERIISSCLFCKIFYYFISCTLRPPDHCDYLCAWTFLSFWAQCGLLFEAVLTFCKGMFIVFPESLSLILEFPTNQRGCVISWCCYCWHMYLKGYLCSRGSLKLTMTAFFMSFVPEEEREPSSYHSQNNLNALTFSHTTC